jgi:hypothetical protein
MKNYIYFISILFFYNIANVIANTNVTAANITATNVTTANIKCDTCELSITALENYLQNNHTITELEQVLDNLCDKTPFSHDCSELVNEYLPSIINLLEQKESPSEICAQIHLCNSSKKV